MAETTVHEPGAEAPVRLPVHLPTFARNLWRRRAIPAVFAITGACVGLVLVPFAGTREYRAETVLLYRPLLAGVQETASVQTHQHLVKVQGNLDEVRRRLGWPTSLPALAAALDVAVQKNTDLLFIRARAERAADAAALANAARDVFLANQLRIRKSDGASRVGDLEQRVSEVTKALAQADATLAAFTERHGVADLERTTGAYLQQAMSLDVIYQQALADRDAVEQKHTNIGRATTDLKRKVAAEQKAAGAAEDLTSLNIRSGRLRSAIEEDRRLRAGQALLVQREAELKRAQDLRAQGLLSKAEFDKVQADYEWQKALTVDTEQTEQWKAELRKIDTGVIPKGNSETATSPVLRDVMLRTLDLDLERGGVAERVKRLEEARDEIRQRIDALPALQRDFIALKREVDARETEKRSVEELLAKVRSAVEAGSSDFSVVSEAKVPAFPVASSRRPVFLACVLGGGLIGLLLVVVAEARDRTFKSAGDVAAQLGDAPLLALPRLPAGMVQAPGGEPPAVAESFRALAWRLRQSVTGRGVRVLVVAATPGEGTTFVASHLAAALGRLDERVLLVDAHVRSRASAHTLREMALTDDPLDGGLVLPARVEGALLGGARAGRARLERAVPGGVRARLTRPRAIVAAAVAAARDAGAWVHGVLHPDAIPLTAPLSLQGLVPAGHGQPGLGEYLSYHATGLDEMTTATSLPGVECVASTGAAVMPDLLGTNRLRTLMGDATARYGVVVVDAPPVLASVDAEILARSADAALVVVRASHASSGDVAAALARLRATGVRVAGLVLNGVDRLHLPKDMHR